MSSAKTDTQNRTLQIKDTGMTAYGASTPTGVRRGQASGAGESRLRLESMLLSEQSRRLDARLQEAVQIIEPMTALLDEVRLRPLLLRTRCDLCVV